MPLNLASPGIVVREVDLTIGRVDPTSGSIGALVAPFTKGPVEEAQLIESEEDLLQTFGQPYSVDKHYEYWMVASSYLAYGGVMQVIRADDTGLKNAVIGAGTTIGYGGLKIKSGTHYNQLGYDENVITGVEYVAKTPGSYANGIKVATIDSQADQILRGIDFSNTGISTLGLGVGTTNPNVAFNDPTNIVGAAITQTAVGRTVATSAGTKTLDGYIKGIVTGVNTTSSPSTAYKFAAIAVNLILEPFRPPVVATDAPASPFRLTSLLPVAATNCLPATDASIPTVTAPTNLSAVLAVLIVPVKSSVKRISKVVPIVLGLFGSLPGPATAESADALIAGIVIAVGVPAGSIVTSLPA